MDVGVLRAEIAKLQAKSTLNATERKKLKKYEGQLKVLEAQGNADEAIEEIGAETTPSAPETPETPQTVPSEPTEEDKADAEFKLAQAEAKFTGVAVDPKTNPSFQKFLESFDGKILEEEFEDSDWVTIRIHRDLKEFCNSVSTRLNHFKKKDISPIQVLELLALESKTRNKKRFEELHENYIREISNFKM